MFARILGIDPGLTRCGYGLITVGDRRELFFEANGVLTTPKENPMSARLKEIHHDLLGLISEMKPEAIAIEKVFFQANVSTAISVAQVSGILHSIAASMGIEVFEYTPTQIKSAVTGDGTADKLQVQTMVTRLLNLKKMPEPPDAADALGIAITHSLFLGTNKKQDSENAAYAGSNLHNAIANALTSQNRLRQNDVEIAVKKNIVRNARPGRKFEKKIEKEGLSR